MDAFAYVNDTVYLRWFETGLIAYFEKTGVAKDRIGTGPKPLLAPVSYPGMTVKPTLLKLGNTSFVMGCQVTSAKLGTLVARGEGVIVMVDAAGKKTPLPQALREAIAALEASEPVRISPDRARTARCEPPKEQPRSRSSCCIEGLRRWPATQIDVVRDGRRYLHRLSGQG